jgi:hypothetical protein
MSNQRDDDDDDDAWFTPQAELQNLLSDGRGRAGEDVPLAQRWRSRRAGPHRASPPMGTPNTLVQPSKTGRA